MLCDDCKKNEACVHITQISPEGKIDKNLCQECAAKYGNFLFGEAKKNVSVNDFLKGIFSNSNASQPEEPAVAAPELVCPNCGMRYRDFQQTGKIGCSVCYDTFRQQMEPLLRRIHGSSVHSGKIPHRSGGTLVAKHELELLRKKLQTAVAGEEYEQAAQYRDQIRALEKSLGTAGPEGGEA
jgi:protein arginine kinase activator